MRELIENHDAARNQPVPEKWNACFHDIISTCVHYDKLEREMFMFIKKCRAIRQKIQFMNFKDVGKILFFNKFNKIFIITLVTALRK